MAETKTLITADQFFQMSFPDVRTELIEGEVVQMSPPGFDHGDICAGLIEHLRRYAKTRDAGRVVSETGFLLRREPDMVRGPDVAFISAEKLQKHGRTRKFWPGPPDLAVEVLSPDDRASEVLRKVVDYLEAGTRLVWVVDPDAQSVTVYRSLQSIRVFRADEELSGEDVLPGFSLKVSEIFS
jgi:Uma2 family endonuclease